MITKYHIELISVGNGTASRESEQIIVELLKEIPEKVQYVITNEAGASVYSASKLATEEFPNFDVGQRSAASIARRLQDPLAELVKIDPKAIGVGQYQHDMNQKKLGEALNGVVEDSVNRSCGSEHCIRFSVGIYFRYQQSYCEKYRGLPGRKWKIFQSSGAFEGGETGTESLRAVRGLYAGFWEVKIHWMPPAFIRKVTMQWKNYLPSRDLQ